MQESAFDSRLVPRGFGKAPPPSPVQEPAEPTGLGKAPEAEPTGLGQAVALPAGVKLVPYVQCQKWLLAFVNGAKKPNVILRGAGFGSYQKMLNLLATYTSGQFFTYTENGTTYLFAYEVVNGKHVIKVCVDGLTVKHTPNGKAPWTVSVASKPRGVGAIFTSETANYLNGYYGTSLIPYVVQGNFIEAATCDGNGQNINMVMTDPGDLSNALAWIAPSIISQWSSRVGIASDNHIYFGLSDPDDGAAQTPGEPAGVAIMRFTSTSSTGSSGGKFGFCNSEALSSTTGSSGTAFTGQIPINIYPTLPIQPGNPPTAGLNWWQGIWDYYAPSGSGLPSSPPANLSPPNQPVSQNGEVGKWIQTSSDHWDWYPPGTNGTPLGQIVGGDGVTYYVWANSTAAISDSGTGTSSLAPPSSPPVTGAVGSWLNPHPDYYLWISSGGTTTTAASTTWLWLLLLLGIGGGVAWYALD
jgi:hypothetical protein